MRTTKVRRCALLGALALILAYYLIARKGAEYHAETPSEKPVDKTENEFKVIQILQKAQLRELFQAWYFSPSESFKSGPLNDDFTLSELRRGQRAVHVHDSQSYSFTKYEFDARFTIATYIRHLRQKTGDNKVPFNWYDWKDLGSTLNPLMFSEIGAGPSCGDLFVEDPVERFDEQSATQWEGLPKASSEGYSISRFCISSRNSPLSFDLLEIQPRCTPEALALQSASFLFSRRISPIALNFMIMDGTVLKLDVVRAEYGFSLADSPLLQEYFSNHTYTEIVFDPVTEHNELAKSFASNNSRGPREYLTAVPSEKFDFDLDAKIKELRSREGQSTNELNYLANLEYVQTHQRAGGKEYKYFHETSELSNTPDRFQNHMDVRFFSGLITNKWRRLRILNSLTRCWHLFAESQNYTSWLAHDSLYAYLYTGSQFPWSTTQVVQMPVNDLHLLAQYFNQSLIIESPLEGNGRFFIDVQPFIASRNHEDDLNNVDARFIDVDSGLYIDILGVGYSANTLENRRLKSQYERKLAGAVSLAAGNKEIGIISERSGKNFLITDLLPLRLSKYHGLPVNVPCHTLTIVKDENSVFSSLYGSKQLLQKHRLMPALGTWIENNKLKDLLGTRRAPKAHELTAGELRGMLQKFTIEYGQHEELLYWINSQDQFNFRLKELAIESSDMNRQEKLFALERLQTLSNKLHTSFRDPFLTDKRARKWDSSAAKLDTAIGSSNYSKRIIQEILAQVADNFISKKRQQRKKQIYLSQEADNVAVATTRSANLYFLREEEDEVLPNEPLVFKSDFAASSSSN
ncbi:LANO_0F15852g1_1 [Lachancea nothofagi CBS 11611]|uniref:LANO_0F15852g1_1 n=1 Tax=Lachancea nothofagi CBS 11611 TaxID=1266666 RepID=A0A1G4KCR7_9SACH|nr:LANO_0F15852g1_1 [Lachancea nothofagi CBS 11611]